MVSVRALLEPSPDPLPPLAEGPDRRPFLVFDVETNGLPRHVVTGEIEAIRVVRLAWGLYDARGRERAIHDAIVYPDGFEIPSGAVRIHNITTERARQDGRPLAEVLGPFVAALPGARALVAHNLFGFDFPVIRDEIRRVGLSAAAPPDLAGEDTMRLIDDVLGDKYFPGRPPSKLPDAHRAVLRREMPARVGDVHDAVDDVRACAALFFALRSRQRRARAKRRAATADSAPANQRTG